jgi:hypothetical protein
LLFEREFFEVGGEEGTVAEEGEGGCFGLEVERELGEDGLPEVVWAEEEE